MSLHLPARQAANAARASIIAPPSARLNYLLPRTQRRNAWFPNFFGRKNESQPGSASSSPLTKELTRKEKEVRVAERLTKRTQGATIFDDDIEEADKKVKGLVREADSDYKRQTTTYSLVKEHMERALDPDPRWRVRYQKKMVMNMVRSKGKLSKKEQLKFTEKEFWSSSDPVPTSTKKLGFLARQVAGKTVEEAITQMRFSSKKMAREVLFELEKSRDAAISIRGMGLGTHSNEIHPKRNIVTKDGKKLQIDDPTRLYVDQAWVNKGQIRSIGVKYHARGRMSQLKRPSTRINVVLKEEKTRIRLHEERIAKEVKKAPWVHLPNRPVTAQRQYYSW